MLLLLTSVPAVVVRADFADVFARLDLTRPGLEKVRAAFEAGDKAGAAAELKAYFRTRTKPTAMPERFSRPPKDPKYDTGAADAVLARKYAFIGRPGTLTHDIDWNANPFDDVEWPIELNRHFTWVDLARAYWATYDEKYAEDFAFQLDDWLKDNPRPATPSQGKFTWRTLECGIRLSGAWPAVLFRMIDSDRFTPELLCRMLESIWEQADYLMQYHGGGNWLITEKSGVATTAVVFPEFKDAPTWSSSAYGTLTKELTAQVYPDGAQIELTPHYHSATLASFRAAYDIAQLNGVATPAAYRDGLLRMYEYLMYVVKPDGFIPMFNDSDHGNMRSWLADGAARFNRPDMRFVATGGKEGTPPDGPSHAFPWAGQYIMRSGWTNNDVYLALDAGPYGFGHQHEDKLQIDVWGYGSEMILDPGRYTYQGGKWREYFVSTASHSTLLVNGKGQQRGSTSPATWVTKERLDNRWLSQPAFDFAVGSYDDGYETAPDLIHIRKVLFVKPLYFVVTDLLLPKSGVARDCEATVQFQFARPGGQLNPETLAVREGGAGPFAVVCPAAPNSLKVTLHEGEENPPAGWIGWSLHQNLKEPATLARYSQSGRPPLVFDTVILPCVAGATPSLTVKRLPVTYEGRTVPPAEATALEIAGDRFKHVVYLSHSPLGREVVIDHVGPAASEVAVFDVAGDRPRLITAAGSDLSRLPRSSSASVAEANLAQNRIEVKSREPNRFTLRYGYAAGGGFLFETQPGEPATQATFHLQSLHFDMPYVYEVLAARGNGWQPIQRGTILVPETRAFDFDDGTPQGWDGPGAKVVSGYRGSRGALHIEDPATADVRYIMVGHPQRFAVSGQLRVRFAYRTPMSDGGKDFYVKVTLRSDDGEDWSSYFAAKPAPDWQTLDLGLATFHNDTYQGKLNGQPMPSGLRMTRVSFILRKDTTAQPVGPCLELDDFSLEP